MDCLTPGHCSVNSEHPLYCELLIWLKQAEDISVLHSFKICLNQVHIRQHCRPTLCKYVWQQIQEKYSSTPKSISIRAKDPNNHTDTEMGTLSSPPGPPGPPNPRPPQARGFSLFTVVSAKSSEQVLVHNILKYRKVKIYPILNDRDQFSPSLMNTFGRK